MFASQRSSVPSREPPAGRKRQPGKHRRRHRRPAARRSRSMRPEHDSCPSPADRPRPKDKPGWLRICRWRVQRISGSAGDGSRTAVIHGVESARGQGQRLADVVRRIVARGDVQVMVTLGAGNRWSSSNTTLPKGRSERARTCPGRSGACTRSRSPPISGTSRWKCSECRRRTSGCQVTLVQAPGIRTGVLVVSRYPAPVPGRVVRSGGADRRAGAAVGAGVVAVFAGTRRRDFASIGTGVQRTGTLAGCGSYAVRADRVYPAAQEDTVAGLRNGPGSLHTCPRSRSGL